MTPAPTEDGSLPQPRCRLSSQVVHVQIAEQGVLHSAVQCMEARMEAVNDLLRSLSPLAKHDKDQTLDYAPEILPFG